MGNTRKRELGNRLALITNLRESQAKLYNTLDSYTEVGSFLHTSGLAVDALKIMEKAEYKLSDLIDQIVDDIYDTEE